MQYLKSEHICPRIWCVGSYLSMNDSIYIKALHDSYYNMGGGAFTCLSLEKNSQLLICRHQLLRCSVIGYTVPGCTKDFTLHAQRDYRSTFVHNACLF